MNLNLGIFFDGTGNNRRDRPSQKISNVAKLYQVYGQPDDSSVASLYIRGVGSKKSRADDDPFGGDNIFTQGIDKLMGGAFGVGGHDRIELIINQARDLLKSRPEVSSLTIDAFGFSRGAAMARHFVNVVRKDKLHNRQSIRFLGLFDTVGSFGIPGNNRDPFDFGVSNEFVQYIYQLVAENELRENFDLHSIRAKATDAYDLDDHSCTGDRWKVEILCPGVHSDIGGSYNIITGKKPQHGGRNNLLARVYLKRMFDVARKCGVPFVHPGKEDREEFWDVDEDIRSMLSNILGYYKRQPALRVMHAILREAEEHLDYRQDRLKNTPKWIRRGGRRRSNQIWAKRNRVIKAIEKTGLPALKDLFLAEGFDGDRDRRNTFLRNYRTFQNRYMHESHYPSNPMPGMDAQVWPMAVNADLWPAITTDPKAAVIKHGLKREIFYNSAS